MLGNGVVHVAFLAVNERRQPHTGLHVGAPTVKVEVPAGMPAATVSAIEPNDVVVLIFDPDAPQEAALAGLFHRRNVENQAAHFTKKLAPHVIELIVVLVEAVGINENHLQEAAGHKFRREREEVADGAENLPPFRVGVGQGDQRHTLRKVCAA